MHLNDRELRSGLDRREPAALSDIYDRYASRVYGLALRMLRAPSDAEDLVQDVFATLWDRPGAFNPPGGPLGAWLLLLTRTRALDRLRALKSRQDRGLVAGLPQELPEVADSAPTPHESAATHETGRAVRAALTQLPQAQREAIEIACFEGLSQSEVASRLGAPPGTVKTRIRDGMRRMRSLLEAGAAGVRQV